MKKFFLLAICIILFGNCEVNDDVVTITLPEIGLSVDETILNSWFSDLEETTTIYEDLFQESANATKLRHSQYLGSYFDEEGGFGWIGTTYDVDSTFLILDIEFPLPETDGRSIYVQLIRKESLDFVTLDPETDTYYYNDPEDFKTRFLHEGPYDEGDHYAKVISTQFESDFPDHNAYALGFPGTHNDFRIRQIIDTDLGILISGTFKGRCLMFSCGYAEISQLENGTFNAFIGLQ
ncbi:MAG: hypothetical protein DWQ02_27140 [Bacteroidetes bacterium]|nr:MAG: hypothetical protein DWQ02_27140 [Bacteroidota bacterium]